MTGDPFDRRQDARAEWAGEYGEFIPHHEFGSHPPSDRAIAALSRVGATTADKCSCPICNPSPMDGRHGAPDDTRHPVPMRAATFPPPSPRGRGAQGHPHLTDAA